MRFTFQDKSGKVRAVKTLEEEEYPLYYRRGTDDAHEEADQNSSATDALFEAPAPHHAAVEAPFRETHPTFQENQKGMSYDTLLGPYLRGAGGIVVTDPYIRLYYYQIRNFMELLETIVKGKSPDQEVTLHLITVADEFKADLQTEHFAKIQDAARSAGIAFTWEYTASGAIHARHITTDHGWKITLDRGLDIF